MRIVFALVLLAGLGLAGFAVYLSQGFIANMSAERDALLAAQRDMPATVSVIVTSADKKYGEQLTEEDVKTVVWQKDSLPEGAFTEMDALFPEGEAARYVVSAMQAFEPVLAARITEPGEDAGITSRLERGKRAFAISVDVSSGVSGFLRPGDRVDIYWTGTSGNRGVTKLIETGVKLIAVDQTSDTGRTSPVIARTVTVEASPQQVASLAQAQSTGRLVLSLVGAEDTTVADVIEVDQKTLLGIVEELPPPPEEVERVCTTKVRRGNEVVQQPIPCTN
ncbi:Flp pilus assembly protein CpaB [Roseicyclus sp. F158]|uniref:Flp pilus assembly protein CpaB n=1 Tax=Tropicimonas omnivorans TaxID=3075590 RepID=A0ABU3DFB0_9RHOB|nr:Flp pilus assembly protein CpaB [Roseicyclus sp. F158]MDT0682367.1 Flp pilus assembly protein CpaB [Roseicyclus sp. F158]